jgi:formyl-CoA transferase
MGALDGTVVLDLGQIYNGPYCGLLLAHLGARVIKVEPLTGEQLRIRIREREAHEFYMLNSNKQSVCLDLKSQKGRELFCELVRHADVLIENYTPGVMDRLGVGYETLRDTNPRLVYATGKGYGLSGPYADYPAMDLTIQAMGGVMSTTGFPDGPPVKCGPAIADFMGGVHLAAGILAALLQRERTGRGQLVEVSMHDAIYPTLASALGGLYNSARELPERTGNRHSGLAIAPYNVYAASDGHVAILCISDIHWTRLCALMGREELVTDERFTGRGERMRNFADVDEIVESWTSTQPKWELVDTLLRGGVPCAPVLSLREVADDRHLIERGMIRDVQHPVAGLVRVPGNPLRLSDSPLERVDPAPTLGQHTDEVLEGLAGLDAAARRDLRDEGIIR